MINYKNKIIYGSICGIFAVTLAACGTDTQSSYHSQTKRLREEYEKAEVEASEAKEKYHEFEQKYKETGNYYVIMNKYKEDYKNKLTEMQELMKQIIDSEVEDFQHAQ